MNDRLLVELTYGEYFPEYGITGEHYIANFIYSNEEQMAKMNYFMKNVLPTYGMNGSLHLDENRPAIMPYKVDDNGKFNPMGNIIGGTTIPEYCLDGFIKGFMAETDAIIKVGNIEVKGQIDDELLHTIIRSCNKNLQKNASLTK